MHVDKYGMIGPYSFGKGKMYLVLLDEVHTPIPCKDTFFQIIEVRVLDYN